MHCTKQVYVRFVHAYGCHVSDGDSGGHRQECAFSLYGQFYARFRSVNVCSCTNPTWCSAMETSESSCIKGYIEERMDEVKSNNDTLLSSISGMIAKISGKSQCSFLDVTNLN
ncbi:hypothetical protein DPMN_090171 [Dreissena polymorpha]|uniref:Uncharacterized protein n=1 Tax=Dreissena polymorpha TaxID=45954 RepID=A0A9D4KY50_DREPO|nr:hypothetical protein DPMN_090171 [Dreissena polymorpha]